MSARRLVIDCSVVMTWCFEDETHPEAEAVLDALVDHEALVPAIWPLEVANVLLVAERRKRLKAAQSDAFTSMLASLPIQVETESVVQAWSGALVVARQTDLSGYDASYLHLAERAGLPLATLDRGLRGAARKRKVALFTPR